MKEAGIIDPTKVTRNAIENAASIAGTFLLTEAAVIETNKDKKDNNEMAGMPGMF
jgi:chaperonin GroEL